MPYVKSYWTPDEDETGKYWRSFYNKYLLEEINADTIERIIRDYHPDHFLENPLELTEIKLGYEVFCIYGAETFKRFKKIVAGSAVLDEDLKERMLSSLKPALIDRTYTPLFVDYWSRWIRLQGMAEVLDKRLSPHVQELLDYIESYWTANRRGQIEWNLILDWVFTQSCFIFELGIFRSVVEKTWKQEDGYLLWTGTEFLFLGEYYSERPFSLNYDGKWEPNDVPMVDPSQLEVSAVQIESPFSVGGAYATPLYVYHMQALVCDFIDEIISFNQHSSIKGTGLCLECGKSFPRSFYGHGQKYCSKQCKVRAAKRRQRDQKRLAAYKRRALK